MFCTLFKVQSARASFRYYRRMWRHRGAKIRGRAVVCLYVQKEGERRRNNIILALGAEKARAGPGQNLAPLATPKFRWQNPSTAGLWLSFPRDWIPRVLMTNELSGIYKIIYERLSLLQILKYQNIYLTILLLLLFWKPTCNHNTSD